MVFDDVNRMVIDGRFVVLSEIGRGGFGTVYKAHDQLYGRSVAIKQLMPPRQTSSSDEGFELVAEDQLTLELRLQTEMQILARLEHPNIVNVHEYVNHSASEVPDQYSYIVMEYLDGVTLFDTMHRRGRLPPLEAVQITEQLLNALGFIHQNHFIHRDLKPENVFVLSRDTYALPGTHIKLLDFGLAIYKQASQRLTREGMIGGTVWYLSPEQCEGQDADELSDLFSVGMMLFEILTGDLPYKGQTHNEKLMQKLQHELGNWGLLRRRAQVHPELEAFIARALSRDREARFQSAEEMLEALQRLREQELLVGEPIEELPPVTAAREPARQERKPVALWLVAAPVVLLIGWLTFMMISAWSGEAPAVGPDASVGAQVTQDLGAAGDVGQPPAADDAALAEAESTNDADPEAADAFPEGDEADAGTPGEGASASEAPDAGSPRASRRRRARRTRRRSNLSIPRMEMERNRRRTR